MNEAEERSKLLFDRSVYPVLCIDGYRFVDCNEMTLKVMNCARKEQLIGLRPFSISPSVQPDGRLSSEKDREMLDTALSEGVNRFEWKHQTFGGAELWVDVSLIAIPFKGKKVLHTTWRNISREKQMEKNLRVCAQRLMAIVDNSPFATAFVDVSGKWIYVNPKFENLFGYHLCDIPDEDTWFAMAYPDPNYRSMVLEARHQEGKRFKHNPQVREGREFTFAITCKDRSRKMIRGISVPLRTGERLKAFIDIAEQERMKEGLKNKEAGLAVQSAHLQELNSELWMLLKEKEGAELEMELAITTNIKRSILPLIEELKKRPLEASCVACIEIIEEKIKQIASPFLHKLSSKYTDMTFREMQILDLVRHGRATKEIAQALKISPGAVNFHRNNIRRKLGISNEKVNLSTYLSHHPDVG